MVTVLPSLHLCSYQLLCSKIMPGASALQGIEVRSQSFGEPPEELWLEAAEQLLQSAVGFVCSVFDEPRGAATSILPQALKHGGTL